MSIDSLSHIKAAIEKLAARDQRTLQSWLIANFFYDTGVVGDRVAETAAIYGASSERHRLSVDEYLQFEANSQHRHEYIDGIVYAMAGASEHHELITGNLFAAIHGHLRGGPCRTYISNFKLRLQLDRTDLFYYPDVMVACVREGVASHYLHYPKLIVEVLSPSTEGTDRREKFLSYKQIATVEEYVLASQDTAQITIYRRAENWAPRVHTGSESIAAFQSIGLSLAMGQIYEGLF